MSQEHASIGSGSFATITQIPQYDRSRWGSQPPLSEASGAAVINVALIAWQSKNHASAHFTMSRPGL
jgi:hypothetical protein